MEVRGLTLCVSLTSALNAALLPAPPLLLACLRSSYESFSAAEAAGNGTTTSAPQRVLPPLAWLSALMLTVQALAGQGVTPAMLAQLASAAQPVPANTTNTTAKSLPGTTGGETFSVAEVRALHLPHETRVRACLSHCCAARPSGLLGSCTAERGRRARQAF